MVDSAPNASAESAPIENVQKPRILVADDSKLVRKTATKILSDKFDLVLAEDGEEAWKVITTDDTIQVVFTDLGMPNLDGYGLIERVRQSEHDRVRDIPVIVITGAAEEESVKQKVFELGATDFVTKPFKSTEIIARAEAHASYRHEKTTIEKNLDIDLLTGTLNRKGLDTKLEKDVSFINRHKQNLALIVFELDNFKTIATKIKRQGAERVIQHVAKVLGNAIRKEDSFGRYEFAKFVTILPMAKTEGVVLLAKRLCEHVKSFKLSVGGEQISLTMSVGIASVTKGSQTTAAALIQLAQKALANANAVGPGEVQLLKLEGRQTGKAPVADVSIDSLLEVIAQGQTDVATEQLQVAVEKLLPLIRLMSDKQKQRLIR